MDRCLSRALASALALSCVPAGMAAAAPARPSVILLTLDTTRADALGAARGAPTTPNLDALAARGVRFLHALSPAPLTLPAHASLLTGLEPRSHGIRDNGTAALPAELPTLATAFAAAGYRTGAFVASRVLDRRFGLARGFDVYDDRMAAERVGEYGYPERDAAAVTDAALAWARGLQRGAPIFLWVHYYDPHSPYLPPADLRGDGSAAARYAGEVALMDREIGRLLAGLPREPAPLVAAVGDHGEALGEHGERAHGVLLHSATLEVPLLIAGPGVPAGTGVTETVGIRRLAATLLSLAGVESAPALPGPPLPLGLGGRSPAPGPVLSETQFPANAYGWSPLRALTDGSWRLVVGARAELFDLGGERLRDHVLCRGRGDSSLDGGEGLEHALEDLVVRAAVARENSTPIEKVATVIDERLAGEVRHAPARFGDDCVGCARVPLLGLGARVDVEVALPLTDEPDLEPDAAGADFALDTKRRANGVDALAAVRTADGDAHLGRVGRLADSKRDRLAVAFAKPRARAARRIEDPSARRLIDDPEPRDAVDGKADHDGELAVALDELLGAVHRVDDPEAVVREPPLRVGRLLGEDAVVGKVDGQPLDDERVCGLVGIGHRLVADLPLNVRAVAVELHDHLARLARQVDRYTQLSLELHKSVMRLFRPKRVKRASRSLATPKSAPKW